MPMDTIIEVSRLDALDTIYQDALAAQHLFTTHTANLEQCVLATRARLERLKASPEVEDTGTERRARRDLLEDLTCQVEAQERALAAHRHKTHQAAAPVAAAHDAWRKARALARDALDDARQAQCALRGFTALGESPLSDEARATMRRQLATAQKTLAHWIGDDEARRLLYGPDTDEA